MNRDQKNALVATGIIIGLASMAGAVAKLLTTDKGKQLTKDASQYAAKGYEQTKDMAGKASGIASDYMETRRGAKKDEASDWARYLYETWGQIKSRGRVIDHIEVHLEDGESYRLKADRLGESVKRELIGRGEHL